MAKPTLYNLFWVRTLPISAVNPAPVSPVNLNRLSPQSSQIRAIILYPSFLTPSILVGADRLEILLLTEEAYKEEYLRERIMVQLKISDGLDPMKSYGTRPLFVDGSGHAVGQPTDIEIDQLNFASIRDGKPISTKSCRFTGYIEKRGFDVLTRGGYNSYKTTYKALYSLSMPSLCLEAGLGGDRLNLNTVENQKTVPREVQDDLISNFLFVKNGRVDGECQYAFAIDGDVDFTRLVLADPIQSWHPVFHYDALGYANLAHVSDIHVSARQQILNKSAARVIDCFETRADRSEVQTEIPASPYIGGLVNICSQDLADILGKGKIGDSEADLLLISGDLVDFNRNACLSNEVKARIGDGKPSKIWDVLKLDGSYEDYYKDFVDLVSLYSLLLDFCRNHKKPAFLVSGNHDCYWLPFGLSPRLFKGVKRANEGIPADHNLTLYEAILAFGPTYHELKSGYNSPFTPDLFEWFYTVFTPFSDYSVELPRQILIGFGWGNSEDMKYDTPQTGHGLGHLPRSKDAISSGQLNLLKEAEKQRKKVLLFSHFTFVSYKESLPMRDGDIKLGDVYFGVKKFEDHNLGTFECNREPIFQTHLWNIQLALTGHSHRRGLYLVDRQDFHGRQSIKTRHLDFDALQNVKARMGPHLVGLEPAFIVSDSGGTIPRYNWGGEFQEWGSDQPSGTKIVFDQQDGSISKIEAVRTKCCKPRVAVALDCVDILKKKEVISLESLEFDIEKELNLKELAFKSELANEIRKVGISIAGISLFMYEARASAWLVIPMKLRGNERFAIEGNDNVFNFGLMGRSSERNCFISIKLADPEQRFRRYDFGSPWCFEIQVDSETSGRGVVAWAPKKKKYLINRDRKRAEIPDFDWRRQRLPAKYAL